MELSAIFNKKEHIIFVRGAGQVNTEVVLNAVGKALKISQKENCEFLFFDIRECHVGQSFLQSFTDMSKLGESTGLTEQHVIAVLYNPEIYPSDRATLIENVITTTANFPYRMFADENDAMEWVRKVRDHRKIARTI